jgi:hypothetical protein
MSNENGPNMAERRDIFWRYFFASFVLGMVWILTGGIMMDLGQGDDSILDTIGIIMTFGGPITALISVFIAGIFSGYDPEKWGV